MGTPDSTDGKDKIDFANLGPIESLSFVDANVLLAGLLVDDDEAKSRLANEPYAPAALVEIARRASMSLLSEIDDKVIGRCFENSGQMEEFALDVIPVQLAFVKAAHIASGCADCGEKFEVFAKEIAPTLEAWTENAIELRASKLNEGEDLDSVQAAYNVAHANLKASIIRARANYEAVLAGKSE